jgi:hypothetical protein
MRGRKAMRCRLLLMCVVGLSLAALALPIRSAVAEPPTFDMAEQLCIRAGGTFAAFVDGYSCKTETTLKEELVTAAAAVCEHAFNGLFTRTSTSEGTIFYGCAVR